MAVSVIGTMRFPHVRRVYELVLSEPQCVNHIDWQFRNHFVRVTSFFKQCIAVANQDDYPERRVDFYTGFKRSHTAKNNGAQVPPVSSAIHTRQDCVARQTKWDSFSVNGPKSRKNR